MNLSHFSYTNQSFLLEIASYMRL